MKNKKPSVPPASPELTDDDQLTPQINVPYDPNAQRSPDAVGDSIFHADIPRPVVDILKAMILADDDARAKNAARGITRAELDYNPTWNILLQHMTNTHRRVDRLMAPLEFEYKAGRPLMVVKMGSDSRGWIPNPRHFDHVRKVLKAAGVDKRKNILLNHYAIQIEHHDA